MRLKALHKRKAYLREREPIIEDEFWDQAHPIPHESPDKQANTSGAQTPAPLEGLNFSENGTAMTSTSTEKGAKLLLYYVSMDVIRNSETSEKTATMRLNTGMVEEAVATEILRIPSFSLNRLLSSGCLSSLLLSPEQGSRSSFGAMGMWASSAR